MKRVILAVLLAFILSSTAFGVFAAEYKYR